MKFKGNLIPDECFTEEYLDTSDDAPYYKIYCYAYIEYIGKLYDAMIEKGWYQNTKEGTRGDCGEKRVFNKTVDNRKLRVYIKNCEYSYWVESDRFYFNVEYE